MPDRESLNTWRSEPRKGALSGRGAARRSNYVPITILGDIETGDRVAQEEIFGPVLVVMKAGTFEEAIDKANSTRHGPHG